SDSTATHPSIPPRRARRTTGMRIRAGCWPRASGQPYKAEVNYTEDEFCYILEGKVRLPDSAGKVEEYKAGDAFVIPTGFKGVWETVEAVKKYYVIHTPKN